MPTVDQVISGYVKLRDRKKAMKDAHTKELAPLNEKLDRLEAWLAAKMANDGTTSLKAGDSGTAYQVRRVSTSVDSWPNFINWVIEGEQWDMLPHAVSKSVVQEYVKEHEALPPGVKMSSMISINVKR